MSSKMMGPRFGVELLILQEKFFQYSAARKSLASAHGGWVLAASMRFYFPMQKVEKIRFRMSSLVVSPVSESR
jgi:hypothetical protein